MSRLLALALLLACDPAPACADGQQNPCRCAELDGTQTCSAGKYSACDCSAAKKAIEAAGERERANAEAVAKAKAEAEAKEEAALRAYEARKREESEKPDPNDPLAGL